MSRDMLYCFPLADVLLCMDPEQDGRVFLCVCLGGGGGGVGAGEKF